jgi:hypothetical protein
MIRTTLYHTRDAVIKQLRKRTVDSKEAKEIRSETRMSRSQQRKQDLLNKARGLFQGALGSSKKEVTTTPTTDDKDITKISPPPEDIDTPPEDYLDDASVVSTDSADIQLVFSDDDDLKFFEDLEKDVKDFVKETADGLAF